MSLRTVRIDSHHANIIRSGKAKYLLIHHEISSLSLSFDPPVTKYHTYTMDISFSYFAWFLVLLIQVVVHIKVVYLRKTGRVDDDDDGDNNNEPLPVEFETNNYYTGSAEKQHSIDTSETTSFDESESDWDDDEPPDLQQRLSQTGEEMMTVSLC